MATEDTRSHVVLRHQEIKLDDNSPSTIQFSIHPNSTHHQIWCSQFESSTQIVGPSVQVYKEQFLSDDASTYVAISNMLAAALEINSVVARHTILLKIMANACMIMHENLTVGNVNWVFSVELYVVTTYDSIDQPVGRSCDILQVEEEELGIPTTTLCVTY